MCETLSIALYATALHDLMFHSASAPPISVPLPMLVGGVFTSTIRSTVQVSLFNKLTRVDATTRLDYSCVSNLQSMGENLDTSDVLRGFFLLLWVWLRVVLRSDAPQTQSGRNHEAGRPAPLACVFFVLSDCRS